MEAKKDEDTFVNALKDISNTELQIWQHCALQTFRRL